MKNPAGTDLLPFSTAILMGGQSRRFGAPKAFLPYQGKSLAASLLHRASSMTEEVFAVSRHRDQVPPDARTFQVVTDLWEEGGPIAGLQVSLCLSTKKALFLGGVDMPFLKREVVEGLVSLWEKEGHPDVVVPRISGRWEPLCALWSKEALWILEPGRWRGFQQLLSEGPLRIRAVHEAELRGWDPFLECLRNFNTRDEWESGAYRTTL